MIQILEMMMTMRKSLRNSKKVVEIVLERAGDYCEVCGKPAKESMALHHRKLRSRGGLDTPANIIRIHHECHNFKTGSIHMNPQIAEKKGHMVPSWAEPTEFPFAKPDGSLVLLQDDGTVIVTKEGS